MKMGEKKKTMRVLKKSWGASSVHTLKDSVGLVKDSKLYSKTY